MGKPSVADEVQVLRFFETGPIEKASTVFNIVTEKMRERLRGANQEHDRPAPSGSPRKRTAPANQKAPTIESTEPSPQG
jgi:hypothetical protein